MKLNMQLLKLIIRLLILLILFVMLFIISAFLFSAKYWPDVYNYFNANITIMRIPSITELNITILESGDFTTEAYFTTDVVRTTYFDESTDTFDDFFDDRKKREVRIESMGKDYVEMPKAVMIDFVFEMDLPTTKLMTDLVDETNLTIRNLNDVEIMGVTGRDADAVDRMNSNAPAKNLPWLAAIFVKNGTNNQFDYYCDGALLSDNTVVTAATCLQHLNTTVNADDVIVFLGKRSLQTTAEGETIHKVKKLTFHHNFALHEESAANDLVILQLETPAVFSDKVAPACVGGEGDGEAFTTAWGATLSPIQLVKTNTSCEENVPDNVFCAAYGDQVSICPSYGSIYYSPSNSTEDHGMCIYGIRTTAEPRSAICFQRTITYTALSNYYSWLTKPE